MEPNPTRVSRGRFLLGAGGGLAGGLLGALGLVSVARGAGASESVLGYDNSGANTTGTYAPVGRSHFLRSDRPEVLRWGFLPNRDAEPVLSVSSGDIVTMGQISHEGILPDRGNPREFFAARGIPEDDILQDQLMVFEEMGKKGEGPHVVTGPVEGAEPGDILEVRCLQIAPRVYYGVNPARHGKGALPEECRQNPTKTALTTMLSTLDPATATSSRFAPGGVRSRRVSASPEGSRSLRDPLSGGVGDV